MDDLFPVITYDDDSVYFVHPLIICAILSLNIEEAINMNDKLALINLIKLVNKINLVKDAKDISRLRYEPIVEYYEKYNITFDELWEVSLSVFYNMILSRMMCECY